jgi:hypothetical protein
MNAGRCMAFSCTTCDKLFFTRNDAEKCCHCSKCGGGITLLYGHKCPVTWNDFVKLWGDIGKAVLNKEISRVSTEINKKQEILWALKEHMYD